MRLESLECRRVLSVQPFPVPLLAVEPLGSLIYEGSVDAEIAPVGETDGFAIDLDAEPGAWGQTITVVVDPDATLQPTIELLDPAAGVLGTATSGSPGEEAVLQVVPVTAAGQYTLNVAGASDTSGSYSVRLILNAALEAEEHGGPANDQPASAEDLQASFLALGNGSADRGAVLGSLSGQPGDPNPADELIVNGSFETGDFTGWTARSNGASELTPWTVATAGGGFFFNSSPLAGAYSAYNGFDGAAALEYELYQDVTIPPGMDSIELTTNHRIVYTDGGLGTQSRVLEFSLRDTDGSVLETLYRETLPPELTPETDRGWNTQRFDVSGYGGQTVRVHFRESIPQDYAGPALIEFDAISLSEFAGGDWYRFSLDDGQSTTLVLQTLTAGNTFLDLYDGNLNLLAKGAAAENATEVINNFVDTTADGTPDIYFAQVSGSPELDYGLVVTRDADFQSRPSEPESIMPSGAVLGYHQSVPTVQTQELIGSEPRYSFGQSVSVSGDKAIVAGMGYDEPGVVYFFQFDGSVWTEQQVLTPSDQDSLAYSPITVSIDGDVAVAGVRGDGEMGWVYFFRFDGSQWVEEQKLTASDAAPGDRFGEALCVDGDTVIVGAEWHDNEGAAGGGSAYVFRYDGQQWAEEQVLTAADASYAKFFGQSVAIDGDRAVVGAPWDNGAATIAGAAYVFEFDGTRWVEEQKLFASDARLYAEFGSSVAVDGDVAVVGAPSDNPADITVGAAYVFHYDGSRWIEQQKLTASDVAVYGNFGDSVAIDGRTVVVGAFHDGDAVEYSGSAYVFHFDEGQWIQKQKLTARHPHRSERFGYSVSVSRGIAMVGCFNSRWVYVFTSHPKDYAYSIRVEPSDELWIRTATPGGGPGEFGNDMDPSVELRDPRNRLVASDNDGAPDGRNALLHHVAETGGTYTLRVPARPGTYGELFLNVEGASGALPALEATVTEPADGSLVKWVPVGVTVQWDAPVLLSSLEPSDLTVDGTPAEAVRVLGSHTAVFHLPAGLSDGVHDLAIPAGAVVSLQGTPMEPVASSFVLDANAPRVIASSVEEDQTVPLGTLVYTARFDEPLDTANLEPSDVALFGAVSGAHDPLSFDYYPITSTLTLEYADLAEDAYTLTLGSGDGQFEDLAGHDLDGSPSFPLPSGNGLPGGDFVVNFTVYDAVDVRPLSVTPVQPEGSLIYRGAADEVIPGPGLSDDFSIALDDGQTITLLVDPDATLQPTIGLNDPAGLQIGYAAAGAAGEGAVLQVVPTAGPGTYTVTVGGASDTVGAYTVTLILNAAVEGEALGGVLPGKGANDDPASAEDLQASFIALGDGSAERGAVLGSFIVQGDGAEAVEELLFNGGFETGDFTGWTAQSNGLGELTPWTVGPFPLTVELPGRITEVGAAIPADFVEIQNFSNDVLDTHGWIVVVNDAWDDGGRRDPDINRWHDTVWDLPDSLGPRELRYRSDRDDGSDNYWGDNIFWRGDGPGWAMILDEDDGTVIDFVVWGYRPDELALFDVMIRGHQVTADGIWIDDPLPANPDNDYSLQRIACTDHDDATDWVSTDQPTMGVQNPGFRTWPFDPAPLAGQYDAYNGFEGEAGLSYQLYQDVAIPPQSNAMLTTNHRIRYVSDGVATQNRVLEISIQDVTSGLAEMLYTENVMVVGPSVSFGWNTQQFDVSAYAGRTVRVIFSEHVPESYTGSSLIEFDELSLAIGGDAGDADWYRFELADGESATLVVKTLSPGKATLHLYDAGLNPLAVGATSTNASRVINNFVDGTGDGVPDTYFVRVTGPPSVEYSLVVTRNADFDTEPNHPPGAAQEIGPGGSVLGAIAIVPKQKLTASDAGRSPYFGDVVSISGDTAIVGASGSAYIFRLDASGWVEEQKLSVPDTALWENRLAISNDVAMVGARWNDDAAQNAGAVWVFRFDGTLWTEEQILVASDAAEDNYFGSSVGIDGNTAVVGASGDGSGTAYVLRFDGSQWVEQQKLTASDAGNQFGRSVAISGDAIIVGTISATAYVFRHDGNQWSEQGKLVAAGGSTDSWGGSVAIDGDTALIGARRSDTTVEDSGSAHVFRFDGGQWVEQQRLTASDAASGDRFGQSVAIGGNTVVVGAYYDDDLGEESGSAYVFHFDGSRWVQQQKLTSSDGAEDDRFARSVSMSDNTIIMGAYGNDDAGDYSGSAYVFSVDPDEYALDVQAGDTLVITTATPADGPGQFANNLDPMVELYDPAGTLVAADDNSATDGRNVLLTHTAMTAGTYTLRVLAEQATRGEYVLHVTTSAGAVAVGRHVFYNNSAFDGNDPAANPADDGAIAADKRALLPGRTAAFANYTSYARGINGIMIDIAGLSGTPTVEDFGLKVGNDNDPALWSDAPAPAGITVRAGQGAGGSDRVTVVWDDYAIQKKWLQVTVLPGENTGLPEPDVFYFGNAIGETGNSTVLPGVGEAKVNAIDMLGARDNQRNFFDPAPIDFNFDFDRNERVNATDMLIARNNTTHFLNALKLISVPGGKSLESRVQSQESRVEGRKLSVERSELWAMYSEPLTPDPRLSTGTLDWLVEFELDRGGRGRSRDSDSGPDRSMEDDAWLVMM